MKDNVKTNLTAATVRKQFGRRLRAALDDAEMSQANFARLLFNGRTEVDKRGYEYPFGKDLVSKWIKGIVFPNAENLKKVCKVLKVSVFDMVPELFGTAQEDKTAPASEAIDRYVQLHDRGIQIKKPRVVASRQDNRNGLAIIATNPEMGRLRIDQVVPVSVGMKILKLLNTLDGAEDAS